MSIQSILFRPKRGWVDYKRNPDGSIRFKEPDHEYNRFYEIDGVVSEQHSSVVRLTRNPVEFGADISNHAIKQPLKVVIKGVITNSPFLKQIDNKIPGTSKYAPTARLTTIKQTFRGARIREAYAALVEMQNRRQPFTLYTGLLRYDSMVLTNISTPNDIKNRLDLTMVFEEVILPKLKDTTSAGYKPMVTTTELDVFAAVIALATIGLSISNLAGANPLESLGGE